MGGGRGGDARAARGARRVEVPATGDARDAGRRRAVRSRGPRDGEAEERARRAGVRRRKDGRRAVHGDGVPFEGKDPATLAERRHLPVPQAVEYIIQACEGIGEAHARGIVHRDVKPENLFLVKRWTTMAFGEGARLRSRRWCSSARVGRSEFEGHVRDHGLAALHVACCCVRRRRSIIMSNAVSPASSCSISRGLMLSDETPEFTEFAAPS